jgi:multidrug efflux system membrane fusion protein
MDDRISDRIAPLSPAIKARPQPQPQGSWLTRLLWLVMLLVVAAGIAWIVLHPRTAPRAPVGRFSGSSAIPVVTAPAVKGDVPVTLNALGTVTPLATVTVRTQINGQLVQVAFDEGQMVKKGDFLAQIDPRPYQASLDQQTGQLMKDQALLANAQTDLARFKKLVAQDSIARQQLDTQDSLVHQLEGTVKTDQAMVDTARLNLAYCRIVSPITGRIGLRQVDQGNYVQVSDANGLAVVTQLQPISVIFTLPEDNLPAVLKRLHAGATLSVTTFDRARTKQLATGKLSTIDNQIDTTTGTVKLRADFDNGDELLFPNQFVNVQLLVDTRKDIVVVPTAAIQRGAPGTFVYVVSPADETVSVRKVKLGPADGERTGIESGLEPGEKVVTDGADKLREGTKVAEPSAPPASAEDAAVAPTKGQGGGKGQRGAGAGAAQGGQPAQGRAP